METKYIFIIGGVLSSLGKGLITSSIALLLKNHNYKILIKKIDPYLNVDPGTMNPLEHGEVYVTNDGQETDLDLGNYERFTEINTSKLSNITAGSIYKTIINHERNGAFLGKTVQIVPHITNLIKKWIKTNPEKADIIVVEIGGTVGDIELEPFLEAIRQLQIEEDNHNTLINIVGYVPYLDTSQEHKTKPIQHAIKELGRSGIQPSLIFARSKAPFNQKTRDKIIMFCNVKNDEVFLCVDHKSIYYIPVDFHNQELDKVILKNLNLPYKKISLSSWKKFNDCVVRTETQQKLFTIGLVGKYIQLKDAYLSLNESLKHASYFLEKKINIIFIDANKITEKSYAQYLSEFNLNGIVVAGGFDKNGFEGKVLASKYAREKNIPYLGICFGMHAASVDIARNICNLKDANTTEVNEKTDHKILLILPDKEKDKNLGGTLRLGAYPVHLVKDTKTAKYYDNKNIVYERHRHRYEFNQDYIKVFKEHGVSFSGFYHDKRKTST
ncbi:CTP synthase [Mycoplasma sp. SG1]|uniref:CTP synthase n=1 Tax=Mycoplasma sp. SG1 TaxID=2810348 RepID=UPI0022473664|nr:CTP synthase [Mycoplasma sp. SG1]